MPKEPSTNAVLEEVVKTLTRISERLDKLEQRPRERVAPEIDNTGKYQDKGQEVSKEAIPDAVDVELPLKIRAQAEEVLGKEFIFEMQDMTDRPSFIFSIIIPDKYRSIETEKLYKDRVNEKGEKIYPPLDKRSKVIDKVMGANGVRDWCQLVKDNVNKMLAKEGRAIITNQ